MRRLLGVPALAVVGALAACTRKEPPAPAVEMVTIPSGFFWQGCSPADEQCDAPEKPGRARRPRSLLSKLAPRSRLRSARDCAPRLRVALCLSLPPVSPYTRCPCDSKPL